MIRGAAVRTAAALAAATLAIGLAGCTTSIRDENGVVIATDAAADPFDVRLGDCLGIAGTDDPGDDDTENVETVELVPCESAHYWEVFASLEIPVEDDTTEFPGADALAEFGLSACEAEFTEFTGSDWDLTTLEVRFFHPTEASWADGDREVLCIVGDPAGAVEGTLEGSEL